MRTHLATTIEKALIRNRIIQERPEKVRSQPFRWLVRHLHTYHYDTTQQSPPISSECNLSLFEVEFFQVNLHRWSINIKYQLICWYAEYMQRHSSLTRSSNSLNTVYSLKCVNIWRFVQRFATWNFISQRSGMVRA